MIRIDQIQDSTRNQIIAIEQNVPDLVKEEFQKFSPRKDDDGTGDHTNLDPRSRDPQDELQITGRLTERSHTQKFKGKLSLQPQIKSAVNTWAKSKTLMNDFKDGDYVHNNTPGPIRVLRVKKDSIPADAASIGSKLEATQDSK